VLAKHCSPSGHSESDLVGHGIAHLVAASTKLTPQKNESPGIYGSTGDVVGACGSLHVVWVKHDSPNGHSELLPDGHGRRHDEASSKLVPHMNESFLSHDV